MKLISKIIAAAGILACMASVCSCSKAENNGNEDPNVPHITTPMSPEECKDYIQQTCIEAVEMVNVQDFKPVIESVLELEEAFSKGVSPDPALQSKLDEVERALGSTHYSYEGSVTRILQDITITLAPFTGHVTISADGKATYVPANDFQVSAVAGTNQYLLTLTKSSNLCEFQVLQNNNWTKRSGSYTEISNGFIKVSLPEDIELNIHKNGSILVKVNLHIAVKPKNNGIIVTNGQPNIEAIRGAKAQISMSVETVGYKIAIDELKYENQELALCYGISKNLAPIVGVTVKASGIDLINNDGITPVVNRADVEVDIIKKVQVKGNAYITQLLDNVQKAEQNEKNEAKFKDYINKANGCLDLGIYFASDVKQAAAVLSPFQGDGYWYWNPVLVFQDGSSLAYDFEDYFSPTSFANLLAKVQTMMEDFESLLPSKESTPVSPAK